VIARRVDIIDGAKHIYVKIIVAVCHRRHEADKLEIRVDKRISPLCMAFHTRSQQHGQQHHRSEKICLHINAFDGV
jgi:hypothetical protein